MLAATLTPAVVKFSGLMGEEASRAWNGDSKVDRLPALPTAPLVEWRDEKAEVSGPADVGAVVRRPRVEVSSDEVRAVDGGLVAATGEEAGRMRDDSVVAEADTLTDEEEEVGGLAVDAADSRADSEECLADSEAPFRLAASSGEAEETEKRGERGVSEPTEPMEAVGGLGVEADCTTGAGDGGRPEGERWADEAVAVAETCSAVWWLGVLVVWLVRLVLLCCLSLFGEWNAESQEAQNPFEHSAHSTLAGSLSQTLHRAADDGGILIAAEKPEEEEEEGGMGMAEWLTAAAAVGISGRLMWLCLAAGLCS